jgi:hypothetical protein
MRATVSRLATFAVVLSFFALAACSCRTSAPAPTAKPTATLTPTSSAATTRAPSPTSAATASPSPTATMAPVATATPVIAPAWIHQFGSPAWDRGNAVAVDKDGNTIAVGATQGALPGQTLGGEWDAYMKKFSPSGTEMWTIQFTNTVSVGVLAVTTDKDGNIIGAGHVVGPLPGQTAIGGDDAYVRKFTQAGKEVWTRQFGSEAAEWGLGVTADASGNIIVVGATEGAMPGQTNAGYEDAYVRKYSPAGEELWTRAFGTAYLDRAVGVAVDSSGNIILAGRTQRPPPEIEEGTGQSIPEAVGPNEIPPGSSEAFVKKYSPDGTEMWTVTFRSTNSTEASSVAVDASGNVVVGGHTVGALPGQTQVGLDDAFVRKYSPAGTELWTSEFGNVAYTGVLGVAVDPSGNIIACGHVQGQLPGQNRSGLEDAFVRKLSPAGAELWTYQFGSPLNDAATAVAVDSSGNISIVGEAYGALPGQTQAGLGDTFVARLMQ